MENCYRDAYVMPKKRLYLDHASTTPLRKEVLQAMLAYFGKIFGNPSSIHAEGVQAKKALDVARISVAQGLQAHADEVVFTSGGTESNNLGILGFAKKLQNGGVPFSRMHFITTTIEHSSIVECFKELEKRGAIVDYAPVGENGIVNPDSIARLLRPETVLVSIAYANNEIGTIQPLRKISKIIRAYNLTTSKPARTYQSPFGTGGLSNFKTFFHSDGSQAPLYLDCIVEKLGVDLLTLDGHKMYGPKGVGILYVRRGTPLESILFGGGQERGLRSTTENIPLIVGFAKAFELAIHDREKESTRLSLIRNFCFTEIDRVLPQAVVNGDREIRLPNNVNISLPGIDTEFAVLKLDAAGISASTKSSCLGSETGSYVVKALGGGEARANATLRFTFGSQTLKKDVVRLVLELKRIGEKHSNFSA